ncbi:MAG: chaperone modulator CbpM [Nitrosospira sp.]|nr:chaperone modulator CbpM [Nitrosospira sp.]
MTSKDRLNNKPAETSAGAPSELSGTVLDEHNALTLAELSHACAVQTGYIIELVDEGLLAPEIAQEENDPHRWRFTGIQVRRARTAMRLQTDLGINLAGVALALQLLDEIDNLHAQLRTRATSEAAG